VSTRFFAAYTGLLAAVKTALPALDAIGAIYDGPQAGIPTDPEFVLVGVPDPTNDGPYRSIDGGQQDWAAILANNLRPRDESFIIFSTLIISSGDDDLADCRSRADTNISAIETQLRNDLSLGGALNTQYLKGWCGLTVQSVDQFRDAVHVLFSVACRTRI
jgi:hypothetical protein